MTTGGNAMSKSRRICPHPTGMSCRCFTPAANPADDGLREAIAKAMTDPTDWRGGPGGDYWLMRADRVLALPELTELREKAAAADRVRKLHTGVVNWSSPECETCSTYCDEDCGHIEPWPCPTARALDGGQP